MKKEFVVFVQTFCITSLIFMILPINSQDPADYDPWYDSNDDGTIDMRDIGEMARKFGASGIPINKTGLFARAILIFNL